MIAWASALLSLVAYAAPERTFTVNGAKLALTLPPGWVDVQNFGGAQLMLLGPMRAAGRTVVVVSNSGIKGVDPDPEDLAATQDDYKAERERWLATKGGHSNRYLPYRAERWAGLGEVHTIGYEYVVEGHELVETTAYGNCRDWFFNFKTLSQKADVEADRKPVTALLNGAHCR